MSYFRSPRGGLGANIVTPHSPAKTKVPVAKPESKLPGLMTPIPAAANPEHLCRRSSSMILALRPAYGRAPPAVGDIFHAPRSLRSTSPLPKERGGLGVRESPSCLGVGRLDDVSVVTGKARGD